MLHMFNPQIAESEDVQLLETVVTCPPPAAQSCHVVGFEVGGAQLVLQGRRQMNSHAKVLALVV